MLDENSIMPWGKYKKKKVPLKDVPRNYWIFLYDKGYLKGELLAWALENHPILNYGKKKASRNEG